MNRLNDSPFAYRGAFLLRGKRGQVSLDDNVGNLGNNFISRQRPTFKRILWWRFPKYLRIRINKIFRDRTVKCAYRFLRWYIENVSLRFGYFNVEVLSIFCKSTQRNWKLLKRKPLAHSAALTKFRATSNIRLAFEFICLDLCRRSVGIVVS